MNRVKTIFSFVRLFCLFCISQKIRHYYQERFIDFSANTTDDGELADVETVLYVWVDNLTKTDGTSLYFDVYSVFPTDLVMWTASTKGSRIHRGVEDNNRITESTRLATLSVTSNTFTRTVYMEANNSVTGTVTLQAMPVLNTNASAGYDSVKMNGITFGFTPYTPQTEYIAPMPIPEKNWKENEVGIRRNGDYDCGSSIKDWGLGTATANEDDLIRLDISITTISGIVYRLKTADSAPVVRLWNSPLKGGYPLATYSGDGAVITESTTVYAEYISSGNNHVTFELVAFLTATGEEFYSEEIVFRPFESITCAFVGENEQAGDWVNSPGVNDFVKEELLNGYDVHVWDDGHDWWNWDDADEWGRGPAFDTIVNAVNNQGISNVALIGYSHGGGTVYHVAKRLYNNYADSHGNTITNSYQLVFTSYIDAVPNNFWINGVLRTSLDDKPLGTLWHTNQYETNSWVNGCSVPGSDDDIDRSSLGVLHSSTIAEISIDTNSVVRNFLTMRFRQKVNR